MCSDESVTETPEKRLNFGQNRGLFVQEMPFFKRFEYLRIFPFQNRDGVMSKCEPAVDLQLQINC
jgi:hypothetical protein